MSTETTLDFIAKYSHLPLNDLAFYIPGKLWIQDEIVIRNAQYVGRYSNETLEVQRERHPSLVIVSMDEVVELINESARTGVEEIAAERYNDMLECMWPRDWQQRGNTESYKFAEMQTGQITDIFAYITDETSKERRYFTFRDLVTMAHSDIIARCVEFAKNEAKA